MQGSMLREFARVFERKVWRAQVAYLHNAARALSSPSKCFQPAFWLTSAMRKFKTCFKLVKSCFFHLFVPGRGRRRDQRIVRLRAEVPLVSHREERARNLCLAGYRRARLNQTQSWLVSWELLLHKPNKQNVYEIDSFNKFNFSQSQEILDTLIDVRNAKHQNTTS